MTLVPFVWMNTPREKSFEFFLVIMVSSCLLDTFDTSSEHFLIHLRNISRYIFGTFFDILCFFYSSSVPFEVYRSLVDQEPTSVPSMQGKGDPSRNGRHQ